jgi:hypothetical protein
VTPFLTSKQLAQELQIIPYRERERKRKPRTHALKRHPFLLLLGGLLILCILRAVAVYAWPLPEQPITCNQYLEAADYPRVVRLQAQNQQMAAVQIVNDLDGGLPAALVQVITHGLQNTLDVYIFGCSMQGNQPHLTRLFTQRGLIQGAVELTPEHTFITRTLDTRLAPDVIPFLQPLQQNVYHEYAWEQGHFVQIAFPGFYPVTSQTEAEALQQSADNGQELPWNDPVTTAIQMSKDLLQWSPDPQAQLLSRTGDTAEVSLTEQSPHIVLVVTLKQLIESDSAGLWFVTDARTRGMLISRFGTLDQPLPTTLHSPLQFSGANALVDGQTTATLFDHTMTPVSRAINIPLTVHPDSSYSGTILYANLTGGQQGVLLIKSLPRPGNLNKESGQMLLTGVILN